MGTRKPKILLDAEKKIIQLEKELENEKNYHSMYQKQCAEKDEIINGIHDVLDDLGIRVWKDDNKYNRLPITVRLFSWAMKLANEVNQ